MRLVETAWTELVYEHPLTSGPDGQEFTVHTDSLSALPGSAMRKAFSRSGRDMPVPRAAQHAFEQDSTNSASGQEYDVLEREGIHVTQCICDNTRLASTCEQPTTIVINLS